MSIKNQENYKEIPIETLGLSARTYNALMRANINTLFLLIENCDDLSSIRYLGAKSIDEINSLLKKIEVKGITINKESNITTDVQCNCLPELSQDILERPITDLKLSNRIINALSREKINTIAQAILLDIDSILKIKSLGTLSQKELLEQLEILRKIGNDYFVSSLSNNQICNSQYRKREFDIELIKVLQKEYGFKLVWLSEWFNLSRQRVSQKMSKRVNHGHWRGKELLEEEFNTLMDMVNKQEFFYKNDSCKYYLLNNKKDDCVIIIVSEEDIKCFFLEDLPEELSNAIVDQNMQYLTDNECKNKNELGKMVYILKKQHFMPNDSRLFRSMAKDRQMSVEEYSEFLFGVPYCSGNTQITDERIIAFLNENTVDGMTCIPAVPDNQWIRSFISRVGYSVNDFIEFYGFSTKREEEIIDFDFLDDNVSIVEKDMIPYDGAENYIERVYAQNPLIGSEIISEKNLKNLNKITKDYIDKIQKNPSLNIPLKAEMQIALSVINYAKDWDTEDEYGFWKYITSQFGYRDENGQLRNVLCNSVKDALVKNKRWFIITSAGNQYKSSIVVHALTTKKTWMYLCDFLFDFYKTNLNWVYIDDDPMIPRMVYALRNKLRDNDDIQDEDIEISTKIYYFQEGIRKLILNRPKFAIQLLSRMLKRIDMLINHSSCVANTYEEKLCDEWMIHKLQNIAETKNHNVSGEKRNVAIDYTRIKPIYQLINEDEIKIKFPDVRLMQNDFSKLMLAVYCENTLVEQRCLSYYGNELGKTMTGFVIDLEEYLSKSESHSFNPTVVITCDETEIYNSANILFRNGLVFKNKTEVDMSTCGQGGYSIFLPAQVVLDVVNADISPIKESTSYKGYYVQFNNEFALRINNELIAFDGGHSNEAPVIISPKGKWLAEYVESGIHYNIVSSKEVIHIISAGTENDKKYRILVNDKVLEWDSLMCEEQNGSKIYKIFLEHQNSDTIILKLLNLASDKLVSRNCVKLISGFQYAFNKPYYFNIDDFSGAKLKIIWDSEQIKEYPVMTDDRWVQVPYGNGQIEIKVPVIHVTDNTNVSWDGSNVYWIKDIPQECFLEVWHPSECSIDIFVGKQHLDVEVSGKYALGNALYGYPNIMEHERLIVEMHISCLNGESVECYELGTIAVREQFKENPRIYIKEDILYWNQGNGFIGDSSGKFFLNIEKKDGTSDSYNINMQDKIISQNVHLPLGQYKFEINKNSGNLFVPNMQNVATGFLQVGDENELRFIDKYIVIDKITFEDGTKSETVEIKKSYIDQIEYLGIQYVDSEERECPVYTGIMYFVNGRGERYNYSTEEKKDKFGHELYKINPVRIVFINDNTLSITNADKDGIYYYRYFDKYKLQNYYQITDRNPVKQNENFYYVADLYFYTKEGI